MGQLVGAANSAGATSSPPHMFKRAGVPYSRFHALRHCYATALIQSGENAKLVQTLMGHHSAAFTMDVYADLWPNALDGVAARVEKALFATAVDESGSKTVASVEKKSAKSAEPVALIGGPCANRTRDQQIKSLLLYRLS
jgi:Phage integrase family